MMTSEQLQAAAQRTMIELTADELPTLLHALQALEPVTAALLAQAENDAPPAPISTCVAAFPDALRPDCEASSFDREALLKNAPAAQDGCFVVRRSSAQKEARP